MALIRCPECGKQVSNIAQNCPSCGFPLGKKFKKEKAEIRNIGIIKAVDLFCGILGFFMTLAVLTSGGGVLGNVGASAVGFSLFIAALAGFIAVNKDQRILGILAVVAYGACAVSSHTMLRVATAYLFIELLSGFSGLLLAYQFRYARYKKN